jgi:hypothetical protein
MSFTTLPSSRSRAPRRYALKNRERLNRLLMLLQLHITGDDDVQRYAKTTRSWLEANPRASDDPPTRDRRPPRLLVPSLT